MYITRCKEIGFTHKIHEDEIKTLYLGCNMEAGIKSEIAKFASQKYPSIEIYDMYQDDHMYKLTPILRYSQTRGFIL